MRLSSTAAALAVLLSASVARADDAVWRWTDAEGGDHYTNEADTIPPEHRKDAVRADGPELMVVQVPPGERPPPLRMRPEDAALDEADWRARFRQARERISNLEAAIERDEAALENPGSAGLAAFVNVRGTLVPNPALEDVRRDLATAEEGLAAARNALEELDRTASRSAVPREWRR